MDGIGITKQEIENGVKLTVNGASVDINFPEPGLICRITVNDTTGQGLNIGCTVRATGPATLTATTDSSGVATFNIETPGTYTFQTIGLSTGYQSTSEQIGVNAITGSLSITTDYPAYSLTGGTYTITKSGSTYTLALTGISVDAQWASSPFNGKLRLSGGSTQAEYTITGAIATGTTTNITVPEAMNLESLTLALICDVPTSGTQVAQNVINGIPYQEVFLTGISGVVSDTSRNNYSFTCTPTAIANIPDVDLSDVQWTFNDSYSGVLEELSGYLLGGVNYTISSFTGASITFKGNSTTGGANCSVEITASLPGGNSVSESFAYLGPLG